MSRVIWLGTAPFCSPNATSCSKTPGYIAAGTDKCGDGACCWTGQKIQCTFDMSAWKTTPLYSELMMETNGAAKDYVPEFVWLGQAPACSVDACDCMMAGFLPIRPDNSGDGSVCTTGSKWLCVRPILARHQQVVDEGAKECWQLAQIRAETLKLALQFGQEILQDIEKAMSGGAAPIAAASRMRAGDEPTPAPAPAPAPVPGPTPCTTADQCPPWQRCTDGKCTRTPKSWMNLLVWLFIIIVIAVCIYGALTYLKSKKPTASATPAAAMTAV